MSAGSKKDGDFNSKRKIYCRSSETGVLRTTGEIVVVFIPIDYKALSWKTNIFVQDLDFQCHMSWSFCVY